MKLLKKIFFITAFAAILSFTGCYTVVWSPSDQIPSRENNNNNEYYGYYNNPYYGEYYYYYDDPWWYSVAPPVYNGNKTGYNRDSSGAMQILRNDYGGRGGSTRLPVPVSPPSSRSDNTNNSGSTSTSKTEGTGSTTRSSSSTKDSRGSR